MKPSEFAEEIALEYKLFQTRITNEYLSRKGVDSSFSPFSLQSLHVKLLQLAKSFRDYAEQKAKAYLDSLEHKNLSEQYVLEQLFSHRVGSIVTENTEHVLRLASGGTGRLADLFTRGMGSIGLLLQNKIAKVEFVSRDAAGRRWDSESLLWFSARDFAYQSLIESQIVGLNGETGMVVYPDETHRNYGMLLNAHALAEVRHKIFHPNSNAELVPNVRS